MRWSTAFNTEKLLWLNQYYIKADSPERLARLLSPHMGEIGIDPADGPDLVEVVKAQQERAKTLVEMAEISAFFYRDYDEFDEKAAKKNLKAAAREPLQKRRISRQLPGSRCRSCVPNLKHWATGSRNRYTSW